MLVSGLQVLQQILAAQRDLVEEVLNICHAQVVGFLHELEEGLLVAKKVALVGAHLLDLTAAQEVRTDVQILGRLSPESFRNLSWIKSFSLDYW